jgi:hypothetical protein
MDITLSLAGYVDGYICERYLSMTVGSSRAVLCKTCDAYPLAVLAAFADDNGIDFNRTLICI